MRSVRCAICRHKCPNLKILTAHYLSGHSKFRIVSQCLKYDMMSATSRMFRKKRARKLNLKKIFRTKKLALNKPETLYLNDNIQILCSQNKLIIGDENNSLDLDLSFDESAKNTKSVVKCERKPGKKVIRKMQHYRINIKKIKEEEPKSLDHINGTFYTCNCRKTSGDFAIVAAKPKFAGQIFTCVECGSKHKTELELSEHFACHAITCRICNDVFPSKTVLREHVKSHLLKIFVCYICQMEFFHKETLKGHLDVHFEEHTLETVLDMEQDYTTFRYPFNGTYSENINSILYYLSDSTDLYYRNQNYMKIVCDICHHEMFYGEYENHLQTMHFPYNY